MGFLLWIFTRGCQCSPMMKQWLTAWSAERQDFEPRPKSSQYCKYCKCIEKPKKIITVFGMLTHETLPNFFCNTFSIKIFYTTICRVFYPYIEEGFIQKRRQRSSQLFGGKNWLNSLPHYRFSARIIWRNGWIEKRTINALEKLMTFYSSHYHPLKKVNRCSSKNFVQIILAAKWLLRHSSSSPTQ